MSVQNLDKMNDASTYLLDSAMKTTQFCRYVLQHWPKLVMNFGLAGRLSHHITLIGNTFSSISCWIVVALTIDRVILTKLPFKAKTLSTAKRTYISLTIIMVLCCAVNAVWMYEFFEVPIVVFPCNGYWKIPTEIVRESGDVYIPIRYRKEYWLYAIVSAVLFMYAIPAIIMTACNTLILLTFKNKKINATNETTRAMKKRHGEMRLTKMIIVVSVVFLICNMPDIATRLLWKFVNPLIVSKVQPVAHLFLMVNVSANFVVYSLLNRHLFDTILTFVKRYSVCCGFFSDGKQADKLTSTDSSGQSSDATKHSHNPSAPSGTATSSS